MLKPQYITLLGATGSIGRSTLDVIARYPERYQVFALTAHQQVDLLFSYCLQFKPCYAVVTYPQDATQLQSRLVELGVKTTVLYGEADLITVAQDSRAHIVMAAIVGAAGLKPTLAAVQAGKKVLLANKESLVLAGGLFMEAVDKYQATLLPIDSEHNAIFQVLPHPYLGMEKSGIEKILLTASGGPFRNFTYEQLVQVTPDMACRHPNWSMGKKITVDCATLMNKGLELIEAHWLFTAPVTQLDVVVHPQSMIHSMVSYIDGSVLAQMGNPDMRIPISYALSYPERIASGAASLDFAMLRRLDFEEPNYKLFPCLLLAKQALEQGGAVPAILNAANEIAVAAFLEEAIRFVDIPRLVEQTITSCPDNYESDSIDALIAADNLARHYARAWVKQKQR